MKTSILVTAVAGSGKSTVCKALQQLGCNAHDIESIDGLYELIDEKTGNIVTGNLDQIREGLELNCKKAKLQEIIRSETQPLTFYCGGMANTDDVWDVFDVVIVLTVSDATTVRRLSTRRAGEFGSTQANRDWVLSWKHEVEQGWLARGGIAVSGEKSPGTVAELVVKAVAFD